MRKKLKKVLKEKYKKNKRDVFFCDIYNLIF